MTVVLNVQLNVGENLVFGEEHIWFSGNNQLPTYILIIAGFENLKNEI